VARNEQLGERIKAVLKEAGDSQYTAAEKLGVTHPTIWKMTRGDVSRRLLDKFIDTYHLNRNEWLLLSGYPEEVQSKAAVRNTIEEAAELAAIKAAERINGAARFVRGLAELRKKYHGSPIPLPEFDPDPLEGPLTVEAAEALLAYIDTEMAQRLQVENASRG